MSSEFNKPIFHFPLRRGYTIVSFDAQKPWETVDNYTKRVFTLMTMMFLTEEHHSLILCRLFLGGLRQALLDYMLEINFAETKFRHCQANARFLESTADYGEGSLGVEARPVVLPPPPAPRGKPTIVQDGKMFFGEPNKRIDNIYKDKAYNTVNTQILYRR